MSGKKPRLSGLISGFPFYRHAPARPTAVRFKFEDRPECLELVGVPVVPAIWDSDLSSIVVVGEGRPSTRFCFLKRLKNKTKRGWSAFADHDGKGESV
jgi:hypothetical protein